MKILVIGTGYVGLVTGACLAEMGNHVTCIDNDKIKIKELKKIKLPIYEPGLEEIVKTNIHSKRLEFAAKIPPYISENTIIFIAVGTPSDNEGNADMSYVYQVAKDIGKKIANYCVVVNKSTVPVGTGEKVEALIREEIKKRNIKFNFDVVSNPEFLKEGDAIKDFNFPDRIIVGSESKKANQLLDHLYAPFSKKKSKIIFMSRRDSEMTKYAANSMLATKISFMNEISQICELTGVDIENVRKGIGSDSRIGYSFIYPGCGFGGSCFPKDLRALIQTAKNNSFNPILLDSVQNRNIKQKKILFTKITSIFGQNLTGKTFSVWGLSFKPGTDDVREATSIIIIKSIIEKGGFINAYDPFATSNAKKEFNANQLEKIKFFNNEYKALINANALILVTEWAQFRQPNFEMIIDYLKEPIIIDGRNQYDPTYLKSVGIDYFGIGRSNVKF